MESHSVARMCHGLDILRGPPTKTIICIVLLSLPEIKNNLQRGRILRGSVAWTVNADRSPVVGRVSLGPAAKWLG